MIDFETSDVTAPGVLFLGGYKQYDDVFYHAKNK